MFTIDKEIIYEVFGHIINSECKKSKDFNACYASAKEILDITDQLMCIAESATVLRSCATRYGLTNGTISYESTSAHTNLVSAIVDRVLSYRYGAYFDKTEDGFTYREIMEVIRRHDLPENLTGDTPDNGARDEKEKLLAEHSFLRTFARQSPTREKEFEEKIKQLQDNMENKVGFSGKLLYVADKASAILAVLCYDSKGIPPVLSVRRFRMPEREFQEVMLCTDKIYDKGNIFCKASEMWTIDYFKIRKLYQYDITGLVTEIIIMSTLLTNGRWYRWREEDYQADK